MTESMDTTGAAEDHKAHGGRAGLLLGFLVPGAAHFAAGHRLTGILWFAGLAAAEVAGVLLLIPSSTIAYFLATAVLAAWLLSWIVMVVRSYRPVPTIGATGWIIGLLLFIMIHFSLRPMLTRIVRPFEVPTSSMSPTIMGIRKAPITADRPRGPSLLHRLITGESYAQILAPADGPFEGPVGMKGHAYVYKVADTKVELPSCSPPVVAPGSVVQKGALLWEGYEVTGDRVLVDRTRYLFEDPNLGDLVVVRMDGFTDSKGYSIRRVAGVPGNKVSISPPYLLINGEPVLKPHIFARISSLTNGYMGFLPAPPDAEDSRALTPSGALDLGDDKYFLLGDNPMESYDSRFYGPAPRKAIVGRVSRVCWPFTRINALNRQDQ